VPRSTGGCLAATTFTIPHTPRPSGPERGGGAGSLLLKRGGGMASNRRESGFCSNDTVSFDFM